MRSFYLIKMTSTYSSAAYIGSTIDDARGPSLRRNFEGKIQFPSLIPFTENFHDWIDQFQIKESPPSINDSITNNNISVLNNSHSSNIMEIKEGFNSHSCFQLPSNSSEDDDTISNFSGTQYKPSNNYNNQIPDLRPQYSSSYYQIPRPIQSLSPGQRNYPKFDERKFIDFYINPIELNFLPKELWLTQKVALRSVFQTFFKARSTKNLRFEHKLWNALSLSKRYPELIPFLGVFWVSKNLIKVNRDIFGALINVSKPAAALFNNQGSFLTHGFLEITKEKALKKGIFPELIEDVDESVVRLFKHSAGLLTADSNKADVSTCRWNK